MLNKLRLDQTKNYEKAIAANEIAQMLVAFIQGREHSLSIGAEQGGIKHWDDFVVEEANGTYKHIQVKRQQVNFSDSSCDMSRNENRKHISPLDETMQSLADWVMKNNPNKAVPKRCFSLILPYYQINIKKEITIRDFYNLCNDHIRSISKAEKLQSLAKEVKSVEYCLNWLQNYCNFNDCNHILKALNLLTVEYAGLENKINENIEKTLSLIFHSPNVVHGKIILYINDNSTFTTAITPRPLLNLLKDFLLPSIPTWTQFQKCGSGWKISGIHDLECDDVERASYVVPSLWSNDRVKYLKMNIPVEDSTKLTKRVVHLALHLEGMVHAHFTDLSGWKRNINHFIGGTLGCSLRDCETLSIATNSSPFTASNSRPLNNLKDSEDEADKIMQEIIQVTYKLMNQHLENKFNGMQQSELREAIENCWQNKWKPILEQNPYELKNMFRKMLHPNAEGNDIDAELRIGPKTAHLIAESIYLLLIVSVVLNDTNENWKSVGENLSVTTIGLEYWSGPSGSPRKVRKLRDEGILTLIGKEPFDVLILSQTTGSPNQIFEEYIADNYNENFLMNGHRSKLLITNELSLDRLISQGNITGLRNYFTKKLNARSASIEQSIQEAL